jgi:hypothetical protein
MTGGGPFGVDHFHGGSRYIRMMTMSHAYQLVENINFVMYFQ